MAAILETVTQLVKPAESKTLHCDYSQEPTSSRSPLLIVNSEKPFNAEPPPKELIKHFTTPTETFYVRSHGAAPNLNSQNYTFKIGGIISPPRTMSLSELQSLAPKVTVDATLMCAGNRRNELKAIKAVKGVGWEICAIGNALWAGVRLKDLLLHLHVDVDSPHLHVEFVGEEECEEKTKYGSSVPMSKAADAKGDVLLAWEMNEKTLTRDHGFPLRVVVPGYIGARSVKWLKEINILEEESQYCFQQRDYKLFLPNVNWENVDALWDTSPAIGELSVQSAICDPVNGQVIPNGSSFTIRGYAISNGRRITRVDVSLNGGVAWEVADIVQQDKKEQKGFENRYWSWSIWQLEVKAFSSPCTVVCRAWDLASNTQPEEAKNIWNLRGVMNNAWHRVMVVDSA